MYQSFINKFNAISFSIITFLCALLPVFFLPVQWGGAAAVKSVLLYSTVFVAFSFWLLSQFVGGTLRFPKHRIVLFLVGWVGLSFISALLSANTKVSLWGRGFVIDSFATTLVLALFTLLVASFAREQKRLVRLFVATFAGSAITVVLQVLLYVSQRVGFVSKYLGHVANQGTLVGSWVDFAYFVTFTFVLALLIYDVLIPKGFFKKLAFGTLVLSLIVLVFLNFKTAWVIAVVSALLVFVYKSSVERSIAKYVGVEEHTSTSKFPLLSFVALLISLFFFLSSNSIGASISRSAGVAFGDIRPSFGASMHVLGATYRHDPLFGSGAGRYAQSWDMYHSASINQTTFWNSGFDSGYSLFTTIATTNGPLVALTMLAIIVFALMLGFRLFNAEFPDKFSRFISVAALIMFLAFVGLVLFSSPGLVLIVFGFLYLGLLLGVASLVGRVPLSQVQYLKDPRTSFFAILGLVVATMAGFTAVYFVGNRFASVVLYNKAVTAGTPEAVQRDLDRALALSQNDIYWRTRAALYVRQFTTTANASSPDKTVLQNNFSQAEQSAKAAVAWDGGSASNWLTLSQIYQLISSADANDAYTAAQSAAEEAQKRSPKNPFYKLNQAQVALTKKDTAAALSAIDGALALKNDYLDAYILRGQIRVAGGESNALIQELIAYTKIAPNDPQGYTLLGQAYTAQKQYQSALDMYTRVRSLTPSDPNAYLAVIDTLTAMGQKSQALEALDAFAKTFPKITGIEQKREQIQSATLPSLAPASTTSAQEDTTTKKKK